MHKTRILKAFHETGISISCVYKRWRWFARVTQFPDSSTGHKKHLRAAKRAGGRSSGEKTPDYPGVTPGAVLKVRKTTVAENARREELFSYPQRFLLKHLVAKSTTKRQQFLLYLNNFTLIIL